MFSTKNFFPQKCFPPKIFSTISPLSLPSLPFLHWLGASFQLYINEENCSAIISGFRVIPQHLLFSSPQIHFRSICSSPASHILSSSVCLFVSFFVTLIHEFLTKATGQSFWPVKLKLFFGKVQGPSCQPFWKLGGWDPLRGFFAPPQNAPNKKKSCS